MCVECIGSYIYVLSVLDHICVLSVLDHIYVC